jgi:hypothetical protein
VPLGELFFFHLILMRKVRVFCTVFKQLAACDRFQFVHDANTESLYRFHCLQGISTYEYVVAMRAQAEAQAEPLPEEESELSSPGASTTTGLSGGSSFGIQIRGGGSWCTPPRIFIEHQVQVIEHQKINTAGDIF